jgi:hypothetical protein
MLAPNADQELLEHELRIRQATTNIEQMTANIDHMSVDMTSDRTRITLHVVGLAVTMFAAGIAAATHFGHLAL